MAFKEWDEWDYCEIGFQILDDGRGFSSRNGLGTRLMWLRFIAEAGNQVVKTSNRLPVPTIGSAPLAPQRGNSGHQQVLDDLITDLKHDGWTLLEQRQGEWWQRRFRKAATYKPVRKPKLKPKEKLAIIGVTAAIFILVALTISAFINANPWDKYASADLSRPTSPVEPLVGPMAIIDLESSNLDPLQTSLPTDLAVEAADEVSTIVWLDCATESNWRGATTNCAATVIDWPSQLILDEQRFEGAFTQHPTTDDTRLDPAEIRNNEAILAYLTGLPRK